MKALRARDRIKATRIYISITEAGLAEAQHFIKALSADMKETKMQREAQPLSKRLWSRVLKGRNKD
jgi:ribosomal protein L7/L12